MAISNDTALPGGSGRASEKYGAAITAFIRNGRLSSAIHHRRTNAAVASIRRRGACYGVRGNHPAGMWRNRPRR